MAHLLLIDDDPALIPKLVRQVFPGPAHRVEVAGTGAEGLERVRALPPDVILLDLRLPDQSGLEVYQQIRRIDARIPVIFVTMAKTADAAIEAMKQGAYDYLFKPLDPHQLRRVVGEALEVARRMRQPAVVAETAPDPDVDGAIVGSCPAMCEVYKAIGRVAAQDVPVLITGESGTGKELVARAIYQHGPRAKAPFLALNCAAIPENLLEASCSATRRVPSPGPTAAASASSSSATAGTILLDEVGDMPLALQAKMLRVLQEQAFERVGGNETVQTDVRLIAATHRDLKAWSAEGKFRSDLYYRLGVFTIHLPPLRERGDDLPMLVRHYLRRFSRELGREVQEVAPEALERLLPLLLAGQHPRAAERAEAGALAVDRPGPGPGVPARARPAQGGRARHSVRGGVAARGTARATLTRRQPGPVRGGASRARPVPPAAGAAVDRGQPAPGRPDPRDRAANAPAEAPRAGPVRHEVRRGG